ncbi:interferon-related developmental regulator-domain-containing protein [Aspergillus pseudonomiae]|uniref:Interferon-related developmental regulator-domain-containing protein n=1 Tax=Aspergillus pseudonomiae TaxID=1506151 RepID=A0A5N7DBQ6_9EURO|nr:interferon-related developmental regulator-domain-containing protein [Aspergillus pseudonomiae]KAB8254252.1 interferon-related developmental regulator-domain-containing protein [Aspergillus pseudonomiae]KAE8403822.1 interferon-related developmental regulator-domain-containing protein [Aspergillus pseudonomiae]
MPDLRRQVFESGKTISRKAASREGSRRTSRTNSAQNSHQSSRNASRHPSDEEDAGNLSDDTALSIGSLDDLTDNPEVDNNNWAQELGDVIQDILDRKRSSVLSREECYAAFCRLLKCHYVEERIRSSVNDLLGAFCRSVKFESSVRETTLALRALELLVITAVDNGIYENVEPILTRAIRDSTSNLVKTAAIHCLGACTIFGGAGEDGILDQMTFFLDIAASDGQSIDATDDPSSVTAALQEWGVLAVEIEDLEGESEDAIQIFMDQLNSSESPVQIAAGENIALLYEKSYTPQEDDDDEDSEPESDGESLDDRQGPKLIKRYEAYHNTHELEQQLQSLATVHNKRISKKDKKNLHSNFVSILTTVEDPRRGPMYNTAIDQDTNRHYGSKLTVKVGRQGVMNIDRWWKWIRLNSLRRILQGGFAVHYYQGNRAVLDSLPVMVRQQTPADRGAAKKTAKSRNSRRWAVHEQSDEDY